MDGRWEEEGFSVLEWQFTEKQGEGARMSNVIMDGHWRPQYELNTDTDG